MKDYYDYRSFYCGHCHTLKAKYSRFSSLLLSYEAVFISILFSMNIINSREKIRCTALPLIKIPIFSTDTIYISTLINQIFIYAKIKDKIYDKEGEWFKVVNLFLERGKNKTYRRLNKIGIDLALIFNMLEQGQCLEKDKLDFLAYSEPYKNAMEYIFYKFAKYCKLDQHIFKRIGGDFLLLMNLLDAADDYYNDLNGNQFNPVSNKDVQYVIWYINENVPFYLDNIVKNVFNLHHPYEKIILNILGENITSEKNRIIDKLNNKGEASINGTKLLRYFRSL